MTTEGISCARSTANGSAHDRSFLYQPCAVDRADGR